MATRIITIDGPAGAGKSTVARLLAQRLGFDFLDTGAMYRAITWAALRAGLDCRDSQAVAQMLDRLSIEIDREIIRVNGRDVTNEIRDPDVTAHVSDVADNRAVRQRLVQLQRQIAATGDFVCEGRDQGSVAFPDADCKIFLTASPPVRARRRFNQLVAAGNCVEFETVLNDQQMRDHRDRERPIGKLLIAADAIEVQTDELSLAQVVDRLESLVRERVLMD